MSSVIDAARSRLSTSRTARRFVAGFALAVLCLHLAGVAIIGGPRALVAPSIFPGIVMHGLFVLALVASAVRVIGGSLDPDRFPRLVGWYLGGACAFGAINLALIVFFQTESLAQNLAWFLFAVTMGAGAGFVVGLTEARAIDRAVTAERTAAETEYRAAQADRFSYVNTLLRHEVLNNVQVIHGQATYLRGQDLPSDVKARLAVVERRSEDMADIVEDLRAVNRGLENPDLTTVDLAAVLRSELTDVKDTNGEVELDLMIPDAIAVRAGRLLSRVFGNLFANAIEHNEAPIARLTVTVEAAAETVAVRVADNGIGIQEDVRETLFDRGQGPHGVGLYLVDTLLTQYGGSVELTDTGPDGTVFTVTLPRVASDADTSEAVRTPVESSTVIDGKGQILGE